MGVCVCLVCACVCARVCGYVGKGVVRGVRVWICFSLFFVA